MYGFVINRNDTLSISKQLQNQIRSTILAGKLQAGEKLPPSRSMAKELGVSRNTVIQVYEQLIAEGYLDSITGSGTYVVDIGRLLKPESPQLMLHTNQPSIRKDMLSFSAGDLDTQLFPYSRWSLELQRASLVQTNHSYPRDNYVGNDILRKEICDYVYRAKGIDCDYRQIAITAGTSGSLDLLARLLKKKKNKILIEDPCISFVKSIFSSYNYTIEPIPVDEHGIDMKCVEKCSDADLIYVVPSHQYPMGGVLPVARRIALLQYASAQNLYVIEDDYDCEFRYCGEPVQSLRNLEPERVIYCGSFSKIFSPSIRMGYMILPCPLCKDINEVMEDTNMWVNPTLQLAMAEFLKQKYLDKHVYKMKKLYAKKRLHLMNCIQKTFGSRVEVSGENAGLHLLFRFEREFTKEDAQALDKIGIEVEFVEDYSMLNGMHKNELVLGYGKLSLQEIAEGVKRLKAALDKATIPH